MTREEWLQEASIQVRPTVYAACNRPIPDFYVSVGFPKGHAGRQRAIGQCWSGQLSEDKKPHIFICPTLSDPVEVLATLIHEIIHTVVPEAGHRMGFSEIAAKCGLVKPWTATTASPALAVSLTKVSEALGPYPHAALTVPVRGKKGSRMRKHVCSRCGSIVYKGADIFRAMCMEDIDGASCGGMFESASKDEEPSEENAIPNY